MSCKKNFDKHNIYIYILLYVIQIIKNKSYFYGFLYFTKNLYVMYVWGLCQILTSGNTN